MPTANINLRRPPALRLGVYAVTARIDGGDRDWPGVAAIGVRPTLGVTRCLLETHFFDPPGHLYGKTASIEFRHFLRPEERRSEARRVGTEGGSRCRYRCWH